MAEADLRAAIEGPARQAGLLLEAGSGRSPGAARSKANRAPCRCCPTPCVRPGNGARAATLTVDGYRATGGIRGAVSHTAEEVYQRVPADRRAELRDLLLRLVGSSLDGEPVSHARSPAQPPTDPDHDDLVDLLVDARLVTSDDGVVELLARVSGPGLAPPAGLARRRRGWPADPSSPLRRRRRLGLDGPPRHRAVPGSPAPHHPGMAGANPSHPRPRQNRTFLDDARRHTDAEARREGRTRRRRRGLVAAVALLVVAAALAGLLAFRQAERAEVAAVTADARRAAALAGDADAVDQALLLAVEAVDLQDSGETRAGLLAALSRSPALIDSLPLRHRHAPGRADPVVAASPDGETLIAGDGAVVAAHEADTLDVVHTFDAAHVPSRVPARR